MGPQNAVLGVAGACGHPHWGLRWTPLFGNETVQLVWRTHVATPTGALGGPPPTGHATLYWV
eukprot:604748-Pyramimonas_sp.AAC.1